MNSDEPADDGAANVEEIRPFLIVMINDGGIRTASWRTSEGHETLAMFLNEETAERYRDMASLDDRWRIFQPDRDTLIDILAASIEGGMVIGALDPSGEKAERLFDLRSAHRAATE